MAFNFTQRNTPRVSPLNRPGYQTTPAKTKYPSYVEETVNDPGRMGSTYEGWEGATGGTSGIGAEATQSPGPYADDAWDYYKIARENPGYTPQQIHSMQTKAIDTQASASSGMADKIRQMMAAKGLGGGGYENRAITGAMLGSEGNLQNALLEQNLAAAEAERTGRMGYAQMGLQGAGTLGNQLINQQGIDMDKARLDAQMYQYGQDTDYDRNMNAMNKQTYEQQMADYNRRIASLFGNSGGTGGLSMPSWARR